MFDKKDPQKNIEGMQSYEEVQLSIMKLGKHIGNGAGDSKSLNMTRIASMRSLLDLFEEYTNMMSRG